MDRRAFRALATAAVIALISVPIALITTRDLPRPSEPQAETRRAGTPAPSAPDVTEPEPAPGPANTGATADTASPQTPARPAESAPRVMGEPVPSEEKPASDEPSSLAASAVPAPAAAPPPPPPPPSPSPSPDAAQYSNEAADQEIVLTGTRVRKTNRQEAAGRAATAQPADAYGEFVSRLRSAARSGDRSQLIRLIAFPLSVHRNDGVETYRSRKQVERDFEGIFTPRVKAEILGRQNLQERGGGRLKGSPRLWFGPSCPDAECDRPGPIGIREVTP